MALQRDLKEFVELLNAHGVEYVIVGGHAVAFHGYPRYTGDIDFFLEQTIQNATKVLTVLAAFGFADTGVTVETLLKPGTILQLGRPPHRIDLLTVIDGVSYTQVRAGSVAASLDGVATRFIGLRDLLQNKRSTGRKKDEADVEALEANDEDGS